MGLQKAMLILESELTKFELNSMKKELCWYLFGLKSGGRQNIFQNSYRKLKIIA